jgi:hypothetical protein
MVNSINKLSICIVTLFLLVAGCSKQEKNQTINSGKDTFVNKTETDKKVQSNSKDSINNKKDSINIKERTFQDFAKIFMSEAFSSPEKLSEFSENTIFTSSILGNFKSTPLKEFKELTYNRKFYKKHRIKKNLIYIYSIITDYDPKGSELGMNLYFREYNQPETGIKTWKLYKIVYEGC